MSKISIRGTGLVVALVLVTCLTGCGGPSEGDVRQAVYTSMLKPMQELNGQHHTMDADDKDLLNGIHLVSCDKVASDTYHCQVTGFMSGDSASTLTVIKTDSGWVLGQGN